MVFLVKILSVGFYSGHFNHNPGRKSGALQRRLVSSPPPPPPLPRQVYAVWFGFFVFAVLVRLLFHSVVPPPPGRPHTDLGGWGGSCPAPGSLEKKSGAGLHRPHEPHREAVLPAAALRGRPAVHARPRSHPLRVGRLLRRRGVHRFPEHHKKEAGFCLPRFFATSFFENFLAHNLIKKSSCVSWFFFPC